jgi:hypothetical protein
LAKGLKDDALLGVLVELGLLAVEEVLLDGAQVVGVEDLALLLLSAESVDEGVG